MSGAAGLDLRYPIGGLFVVLGVILAGYGVAVGAPAPTTLLPTPTNINLWWGVIMLGTGVLFLLLAWRAGRAGHPSGMHPTAESPEGRLIEAIEHREGLER